MHMLIVTNSLISRLKEKDEEAFNKIYHEYVKLVYHIAYSYTYNKEDSEDIVNEVFMKVMRSIDTYEEKGKFKEWISQITRNVSYNFVTRDKEKDTILEDEMIRTVKDSNDSHKDLIIMFEENLDKDTTSIMILRFIYNYKFREIATYLGMSIGKVQGLYYDGIEKLRRECS